METWVVKKVAQYQPRGVRVDHEVHGHGGPKLLDGAALHLSARLPVPHRRVHLHRPRLEGTSPRPPRHQRHCVPIPKLSTAEAASNIEREIRTDAATT